MLHAIRSPGILSCHRYPVGSLLSFRWRALVSSGHALQGQTCQDLATYNIKHSFSQRKPGRFPKLPDRFFLDTPLCSTDRSFLRPGRFIFLLLFDSVFQRQEVGISAFHTTPPPYFTKPFPAPKLPISHYFSHFATTNFLALRNSNMHNSALHSPSQTCYYFFITFTTIECHFYTNKPTKWAVGKFISLALARSTRN